MHFFIRYYDVHFIPGLWSRKNIFDSDSSEKPTPNSIISEKPTQTPPKNIRLHRLRLHPLSTNANLVLMLA